MVPYLLMIKSLRPNKTGTEQVSSLQLSYLTYFFDCIKQYINCSFPFVLANNYPDDYIFATVESKIQYPGLPLRLLHHVTHFGEVLAVHGNAIYGLKGNVLFILFYQLFFYYWFHKFVLETVVAGCVAAPKYYPVNDPENSTIVYKGQTYSYVV